MATVAKQQKVEDGGKFECPSTSQHTKKLKAAKTNRTTDQDPGEWDVDNYRTEYESEEHWELRRNFMLAHKDRFDEERLVCLAQTFINMEFMGCKYPRDTMLLVAELSKEIAEEFRQSRSMRLKRTFVSASDAAEQRIKGRRATIKKSRKPSSPERVRFGGGEPLNLFADLRYGNLIIYLAGGRNCLRNSCNESKMIYEERQAEETSTATALKSTHIFINNECIATGTGESLKEAKLATFRAALLLLQTHCYSIKLNATRETIKVEKSEQGVNIQVTHQTADNSSEPKLNTSNKGFNIMRFMGWTGGGLGRLKQGREEPVGYLFRNNRMGLGSNNAQDMSSYRTLIENYVNSDDLRDMQFESTFSKEERADLHQIAGKYGLRSASGGTGESRRLLITKKISYNIILNEVLIGRNPKFCERYFVQVPMQKAHLFPGHVTPLTLDID